MVMYRLAAGGLGIATCALGTFSIRKYFENENVSAATRELQCIPYSAALPTRAELVSSLKSDTEWDILVIGGGATGCGVALDAATRGLKTALVERDDYSSGTSSRSTKLIHGGVRYLQKAIMKLDRAEYNMVKEALHERANLLAIAPHIAAPLPIMLPVYKWWQVPYFWVGIKMYDLVAGRKLVKSSYFLGKTKSLEAFPMLKSEGLCGAIIYYDGQQNDSRMNLAIAQTAVRHGATCANHVEVTQLLSKESKAESSDDKSNDVICGARVRDVFTQEEWDIKAKCVVNAAGPFTDAIRQMGDETTPSICQPSAGVHIILPEYYSPKDMGLLDPATSDGRIIFFLPWEGKTIAGTTDRKCDVTYNPEPTEEEVEFIINEVKNYLSPDVKVRREDILAAWSGIRPLVIDPNSSDTKSLSRNHMIHVAENRLLTIAGGKWTTYRAMAKDTVDAAIKACELEPATDSGTDGLLLEGAQGWTPNHYISLAQDYGVDTEVARHLSHSYGTKSQKVAELASITGRRWPVIGKKLVEEFPFIEADVRYAIRQEYACTAVDMIARRMRLAFLNAQAASEVLPRVVEIMSEELSWDEERQKRELEEAKKFLCTMSYNKLVETTPVTVSEGEVDKPQQAFQERDPVAADGEQKT